MYFIAAGAQAVTPSDTNDLPNSAAMALYVGVTGNVTVCCQRTAPGVASQQNVTFTAVPAGTVLPLTCFRVLATGTTATGIVALF